MLAYVFWHWPRAGVPPAEYEDRQRRFHAALQAAPSAGFQGSRCLGLAGAPWSGGGGPAYEDWYLLEGSAALDPLNTAAVTASRQAPHDAAAALADGGTAGLYTLRLGVQRDAPCIATWFQSMPPETASRSIGSIASIGMRRWFAAKVPPLTARTPRLCTATACTRGGRSPPRVSARRERTS